jgi:hypothetical protein
MEVRSYQSPMLTVIGSFEEITQGTSTGNYLDKTFPVGTPKDQLTFS